MCMQVLELAEPVEDALGFVYERAAIMNWFVGQRGGGNVPVEAPFAGTGQSLCMLGIFCPDSGINAACISWTAKSAPLQSMHVLGAISVCP